MKLERDLVSSCMCAHVETVRIHDEADAICDGTSNHYTADEA
jgi:hypothetical protein